MLKFLSKLLHCKNEYHIDNNCLQLSNASKDKGQNSEFKIVCKNAKHKFGDSRESRQHMKRCYWVSAYTYFSSDYEMDDLFDQKEFIYIDEKDEDDAVVSVYYPLEIPGIIRLSWYVDTYSGLVDFVAVNGPGWVDLKVSSKRSEDEDKLWKILRDCEKLCGKREYTVRFSEKKFLAIKEAAKIIKKIDPKLSRSLESIAIEMKIEKDKM